jgi:hypothetical protein
MMSRKNRIEKLESGLKPSDLISLWLSDLHQFEAPSEYLKSALDSQESRSPELLLIQQAGERRKTALNLRSLDAEISRSLRRLLFLKALVWATNAEVDRIVVSCRSQLDLVRQSGGEVLDYRSDSDAQRQSDELSPPGLTASEAEENIDSIPRDISARNLEFFAVNVHRAVSETMIDLRATRLAKESISTRFFHKRNILFGSIAQAMDEACQAAQIFAENLPDTPSADTTNSEQLERAAQDRSAILVVKLIDFSKATVALRFGERTRALEALQPHLSRGKEGQGRLPS